MVPVPAVAATEAAVQVAKGTPGWVYAAVLGTIGVVIIGTGLIGLYTIKAITAPLQGGIGGLLFGNNQQQGGQGGGFKLFKGALGGLLPM